MDKTRRKELAEAEKQRAAEPGIFAVRGGGKVWVGKAPDIGRKQAGLWFQLKNGGFPNRDMQAAWNEAGEAGFVFEVLEKIANDNPLLVPVLLKEREAYWREKLNAAPFTA